MFALVFGLAAVWSGGIALPFGIHVALNILQPLTGMRGDTGAVWILRQNNHKTTGLLAPDTIGLIMQLVVLVAAVLFTEYYIRIKGNQWIPDRSAKPTQSESSDALQIDFLQEPQQTAHNSSSHEKGFAALNE